MLKFINSIRASSAHMNAMKLWSGYNRADALAEIYKAVRLETNSNLLVKHLVFKGEIEQVLGKSKDSIESLTKAKELISKDKIYWEKSSNLDVKRRLDEALNDNA